MVEFDSEFVCNGVKFVLPISIMPAFDVFASSLFIASAMPSLALVISAAALSLVVVVRVVNVVRPVRAAPSRARIR